jgi:MYXO-CTERM domain-containing protein
MRTPLALVAAGLALTAGTAHADLLPDNHKGLTLSIQVDAELPAKKRLVLANTFRGAMVIEAGEVQKVDWHPSGGEMELVLVDAGQAAKIAALRDGDGFDREGIAAIVAKGTSCGESFRGVRTIPDSSPAEELRWVYRVSVSGDGCEATQERQVYLDGDGGEVEDSVAAPRVRRDGALADPPDPKPEPASAAEPAAEEAVAKAGMATPSPAAKGGCGCVSDPAGSGGAGGLALAALVLGVGRRRRGA